MSENGEAGDGTGCGNSAKKIGIPYVLRINESIYAIFDQGEGSLWE